jgi:hypothetical protein
VGGAYLGSSAHWIGLLADLAGRADEAVALLRQALASYRDLEAAPWIASTLAALAAVLGRRDGPGDCAEAAGMTDQASAAARRLGLERIAAALDGAPGLAPRGPRSNP